MSGIRPKVFSQTGSPLNLLTPTVAWSDINNTTITTGQADPFGTTTGVLLEDNSASTIANAETPAATVAVTDPLWMGLWVQRNASAANFCSVFAREGGSAVAGVHLNFATGELDEFGTTQASMVRRFGDWYFVAFRYVAGVVGPTLGVRAAAGTNAAFPR